MASLLLESSLKGFDQTKSIHSGEIINWSIFTTQWIISLQNHWLFLQTILSGAKMTILYDRGDDEDDCKESDCHDYIKFTILKWIIKEE